MPERHHHPDMTGEPHVAHPALTATPAADDAPEFPGMDRKQLAAICAGTLLERCGMRVVSLRADGGEMTMPVTGNTQPAGLLHGGATIALAESVASLAAIVHAREIYGERAQAVGTSVAAVHHRSARSGDVLARARAQHLGRRVASYLVEVTEESGALLSTVTVSTMLLPPSSGDAAQPGVTS
ncbi:PaaI family thioesterase [Brachybacterium timonense]|uniref:PaaI family thioesterase n=1 Tax=Brachybacterium timonense TaxID=2050896 RepID=UPI001FEC8E16|nr:hotdog fold thioesterase [Brachybacterium timonense]